jgi:hypothetical protein
MPSLRFPRHNDSDTRCKTTLRDFPGRKHPVRYCVEARPVRRPEQGVRLAIYTVAVLREIYCDLISLFSTGLLFIEFGYRTTVFVTL